MFKLKLNLNERKQIFPSQIPILALPIVRGFSKVSSEYLLTKSCNKSSESAKSEASFLNDCLWHLIKVSWRSAVNQIHFFISSPLRSGSLSLMSSSALICTYSSNKLHLNTCFLYLKQRAFEATKIKESVALVANCKFLLWKKMLQL